MSDKIFLNRYYFMNNNNYTNDYFEFGLHKRHAIRVGYYNTNGNEKGFVKINWNKIVG